MTRGTLSQEVSCVVALSTQLYPALLHRKGGTTGSTSSTAGFGGYGGGAAAGHGTPREVVVPGVILEVRQLWHPSPLNAASSADTNTTRRCTPPCSPTSSTPQRGSHLSQSAVVSSAPVIAEEMEATAGANHTGVSLYAFVRVKETDHRLSAWFPVDDVYVKTTVAQLTFGYVAEDAAVPASAADTAATPYGLAVDMVRLSHVLHRPWLSSVYGETTPGMARTQRARRQLDYLEERLLRDCRTPTTVRYFVYLNTYVFTPWYYAPFGLLNSEYDPMLPWTEVAGTSASASSASTPTGKGVNNTTGSSVEVQQQPFIRDAFLCPFSLRIYSTYAQMHYETRTYRADRLRPPGDEVYRDEMRGLFLFKINGSQHVTYCRHLFLIGKSFLENKLAGHDVHSYYFYVLCLHHRYFPHYVSDPSAMYFAGFFTWEKHVSEYNLACIVTLPCFGRRTSRQRSVAPQDGATATALSPPQVLRHLGQFMIAVSYELAYRRKQIGTPEKPLSDLGAIAYQQFWRRAIVRWMKETLNTIRRANAVDVDGDDMDKTVQKRAQGGAQVESRGSHASDTGVPLGLDAGSAAVEVVMLVEEGRGVTGGHDIDRGLSEEVDASLHERHSNALSSARKRSRVDAKTEHERNVDDEETRLPFSQGKLPLAAAVPPSLTKKGISGHSAAAQSPTGALLAAGTTAFTQRTTIRDIAVAVRLEEADVLKTLLGMGVLHRSGEDRGIQLLLPQRYVDWMYDETLRWESSLQHAVFQPALLKSRGFHTSTR